MSNRHLPDELDVLRQQNLLLAGENARLKEMLGLGAPEVPLAAPILVVADSSVTAASSPASKIELFKSLFRGRTDVYAKRWQSRSGGSGYSPACGNEWRSGLCDKRRVKCADCTNREQLPLDEATIQDHLTGRTTVGIYPMLEDETCHFLAIDFDDATWREDVAALRLAASVVGVECHVEVSRSGAGAHAWFGDTRCVRATLGRSAHHEGGTQPPYAVASVI